MHKSCFAELGHREKASWQENMTHLAIKESPREMGMGHIIRTAKMAVRHCLLRRTSPNRTLCVDHGPWTNISPQARVLLVGAAWLAPFKPLLTATSCCNQLLCFMFCVDRSLLCHLPADVATAVNRSQAPKQRWTGLSYAA